MPLIHSFDPVIGTDPKILVLGSMPSVISLQQSEYYAHPRNAFWPIMGELFGIETEGAYTDRIEQFSRLPLILWDTLKTCIREGSVDASIQEEKLEANDIPSLLKQYPTIRTVAFNGRTSEKFFRRLVAKKLPQDREFELLSLPSTSPANAGLRFEDKLAGWRLLLAHL